MEADLSTGLRNTIDQWASDPVLVQALGAADNEVCTDYRVLTHLLSRGAIDLATSDTELQSALGKSQMSLAKSAQVSERHIMLADRCWCKGQFLDALDHYNEAIRYMPLLCEDDYSRLATIYFRRMRVGLEAHEEDLEVAVKDIELATMASIDTVKLLLKECDILMQDSLYQERDGKPLIEPDEAEQLVAIHPAVQFTKVVDPNGTARLALFASQDICAGTTLLTEKPFVSTGDSSLKACARCDLPLDDDRFWPCQFCIDTLYCSRMCEEANFAQHKFVCGFSDHLQSKPFYAFILKLYFRSGHGPTSSCSTKIDHIGLYTDAVRNGQPVESFVLNCFRQLMDQHERRHMLQRDLRQYFACLLLAIELAQLYEACCVNARRLEKMRVIVKESGQEPHPDAAKQDSVPDKGGPNAETIACTFRDLKRFIAYPLAKFVPPLSAQPVLNFVNEEDRHLLVLSGLAFPAFLGNRDAANFAGASNVVPRFTDHMYMVAASDIAVGQQLSTRLYNTKPL